MSRVTINVNGLSLIHQDSGGVSTATLPDVCVTPPSGAPTPYSNVARSRDLAQGTSLVRADGSHRIATSGSSFARSTGGEPGSGGGVTSGVSCKEATFLTSSFDVQIEGQGACRHTDKMLHNRGNTLDCGGANNPKAEKGKATASSASGTRVRASFDPLLPLSKTVVRRGVDTNLSTLKTRHANKMGYSFVGRYLTAYTDAELNAIATNLGYPIVPHTDGSSDGELNTDGSIAHPGLTPHEAHRLHKGGMDIFAIWERNKYRAISDLPSPDMTAYLGSPGDRHLAGIDDATRARGQMSKMDKQGATGKPVYFTVDFAITASFWHGSTVDPSGKTVRNQDLVLEYFRGIKNTIGWDRTGAYGHHFIIHKLFKLKLIKYGWQMTFPLGHGLGRGKIEPYAQLHQTNILPLKHYKKTKHWGVEGAGALDYDRAVKADFGQW